MFNYILLNERYTDWAVASVHVVLFIMLYTGDSKSANEILIVTIYQMKASWAVRSCSAVYYAAQGGFNFYFCEMKATGHYFVNYATPQGGSNFWICEWNPY